MAGLNFSGRASQALNAGVVDYTTALEAGRAANEGLDAMDRRRREAALMQAAGGLAQRPTAFLNPEMPSPLAVAPQRGNYDIGTKYSPVGITPPGGAPMSTAPATSVPAAAQPAAASSTVVDGEPTIQQWNAMSGEQQKAHLAVINHARTSKPIGGVPAGKAVVAKYAPPLSAAEYAKTLKRDSEWKNAGLQAPAVVGAPVAPKVNTANLTKNTQALLAKIPAAAQTPQGMKIMDFARAVGVNPAVAMATYGMETSFGARSRSWADATKTKSGWGLLQVTPDTAGRVTKYFSDPKVLAKYPNEANNLNALVQMAQGNPDTEEAQIAAGILQMKYIQDIGLTDEKLMGAAYQTNPHEVLKRGAPVDATDGNMSNSDYSSNWNALFSQATAQLGGGASTASSPTPQPAAGVASMPSTGNKSFDSRVKFAMQKAPAEYDFQTQQLMQSREQHINLLKQKEAAMQAEQARITDAYNNASQRFAAHKAAGDVVGMTAMMDEMSATQKLNDDLQNRSFEFAASAQQGVNEYNNQLIINEADRAVRDLVNGDPTRAASLVSQAGGMQTVYQPRTDGGFVKVDQNGQYVLGEDGNAKKFSAADIAYEVYSVADKAKAAAIDAGRASEQAMEKESDLKIQEKMIDNMGTIGAANIKGAWDLKQKLHELDQTVKDVKDDGAGGFIVVYNGAAGKIVRIQPGAVQALSDGTEIPKAEITVEYSGNAGLNTTGAPNG